MSISKKRGPGRPLSFDEGAAVDAALDAFWRHGFRETSVPAVSAATGLSTSSLYNTYGSKLDLYVAALDRYLEVWVDGLTIGPMQRGTEGLADLKAFLSLLEESLTIDPPRGCLIVNTLGEFREPPVAIADRTARWRQMLRAALHAALERAQKMGEIPAGTAGERADALLPIVVAFHLLVAGHAPEPEARALLQTALTVASR